MNKEAFKKFCKDIYWNCPSYLKDTEIIRVKQKDVESHCFEIDILFNVVPNIDDYDSFFTHVKKNFKYETIFNIDYVSNTLTKETIFEYLSFYFKRFLNINLNEFIYLSMVDFLNDIRQLTFKIFEKKSLIFLEKNLENINNIISYFSFDEIEIKIKNFTNKIDEIHFEEMNKLEKNKLEFFKNKPTPNKNEVVVNNSFKKNKNSPVYKVKIKEIYDSYESNFAFEGELFDVEEFKTSKGTTIFSLSITDYEESIKCKIFISENNKEKLSFYKNLKLKKCYLVNGRKNFEQLGGTTIIINSIELIEDIIKIEDKEKEKRVEFGIRTNMTAMDGFKSATSFVEHAKKLDHKAIAIVDKNSVQSFPEFYNSSKKNKIKPIYGVTLNFIEKKNGIINNIDLLKYENIEKSRYMVFDIETTGLSPINDDIIEFGYVTWENGREIDSGAFFISTNKKISEFTKNLTGIDEETLIGADSEEIAIKKIFKLIEGCILVAHNANFDIGFLKQKFRKYNLEFKNVWLDTLALSYLIIPSSQSYRLEIVSKKLGVDYDSNVAHRADYDTKVLLKVFQVMLSKLKNMSIETFESLNKIENKNYLVRIPGEEVTIIAKNQNGLKKLFKLVSIANTETIYGSPKLFWEDVKKDDDLLFGYIGINSKIINTMLTGTEETLEKDINFCDFIGLPYIDLFSHKFKRKDIEKSALIDMIKKTIYLAEEKNKIVIAAGDVRYFYDHESSFHEVYIQAKTLQGRRHYLFKYKENDPTYPKQKFLTTKQMLDAFSFLNSEELKKKIVIMNTIKLTNMIDDYIEITKKKLFTPNIGDSTNNLPKLVYENAHRKYGKILPEIVENRIKKELEPIIKFGFSEVYWISHKLVKKSLESGYLVGSRGSVGSSIVATLSGITEVNPLRPHYLCNNCSYSDFEIKDDSIKTGFDLEPIKCPKCNEIMKGEGQNIPFETFLGFNADKVPDIDLNFSGDYQPIIHKEVQNIFGKENCFRAGTISKIAPKTAYGLSKEWNETLNKNKSPSFVDYIAKNIEGSKRTTGQHPGGIIIVPSDLMIEDFTPINYPANNIDSEWRTTHFDFNSIHDNLLKLDLLGHDDPTAIKHLEKLTNFKVENIPFKDNKVMSLFTNNEELKLNKNNFHNEKTGALGIPEFGTSFVRRMLLEAKPNSFADLVSISGLSHGTGVWTGNSEILIRENKLNISDVISCRDDIMTYLINKNIDKLTAFKIMEKVRKGILLSDEENKTLVQFEVPKWYIDSLSKIQYLFPKAHATAYVMMAWRIAWFKIYYPLEYYATYFSKRIDQYEIETMIKKENLIYERLKEIKEKSNKRLSNPKEDKLINVLEVVLEMKGRGYEIENVDLYKSDSSEWIINKEKKSLIPPFTSIEGLGEVAAKTILEERSIKDFLSIDDLVKRTKLNKNNIEKMESLKVFKDLAKTNQTTLF